LYIIGKEDVSEATERGLCNKYNIIILYILDTVEWKYSLFMCIIIEEWIFWM